MMVYQSTPEFSLKREEYLKEEVNFNLTELMYQLQS
jgi:hypothetical protein